MPLFLFCPKQPSDDNPGSPAAGLRRENAPLCLNVHSAMLHSQLPYHKLINWHSGLGTGSLSLTNISLALRDRVTQAADDCSFWAGNVLIQSLDQDTCYQCDFLQPASLLLATSVPQALTSNCKSVYSPSYISQLTPLMTTAAVFSMSVLRVIR